MASLLNKSAVKKKALSLAEVNRAHTFTRVSEDFIIAAEASLEAWLRAKIQQLPSKGKTITV